MSSMSLTPAHADSATCSHCSAPLVADQRYCLSCGQPSSPVRLAFLDVLQGEHQYSPVPSPAGTTPVAYAPPHEPDGLPVWMRRYAPLFGVLSVLLMAMIIGLLVGHWVTQGKAPAKQVVEIKGLSGAPLASAATTTATNPTAPAGASSASPKSEAAELAKEEKAPAPPPAKPVKVSTTGLQKLGTTTGKKHQEEVSKLGNQPIETAGGGSPSTPAPSEKSIGGGSGVTSIE
jgi:hypothetical protein